MRFYNDPLRSFAVFSEVLCGPVRSFVVLCGPLRYLVLPSLYSKKNAGSQINAGSSINAGVLIYCTKTFIGDLR